jgi:SAM-dependent methyltransferase
VSIDDRAIAFDQVSEAYELGRPGYPSAAISWALNALEIGRESVVLDLGAGTGKLAASLVPFVDRVVAVEPLERMRVQLVGRLSQVAVLAGLAEAIPLPDNCVSGVFAGEAFHWFANNAALSEMRRVTEAHGGLALLWNVADDDSWNVPWRDEFGHLIDRCRPPDWRPYSSGEWRAAVEAAEDLGPLQTRSFPYVHHLSRAGLLAMIRSWTWMAALDQAQLDAAMNSFNALFDRWYVSSVDMPYQTHAHVGRWQTA